VRLIDTRDTRAPEGVGMGDEYGCCYYPSLRARLQLRVWQSFVMDREYSFSLLARVFSTRAFVNIILSSKQNPSLLLQANNISCFITASSAYGVILFCCRSKKDAKKARQNNPPVF